MASAVTTRSCDCSFRRKYNLHFKTESACFPAEIESRLTEEAVKKITAVLLETMP